MLRLRSTLARCRCSNDRLRLCWKQRNAIKNIEAGTTEKLVHDGLSEARRVVLHANGFRCFVDQDVPDAVDLADLCQGHHGSLRGSRTVLIHHIKLCHGPDFTARSLALRVQFLNVLDEACTGEILWTNQLAADDAALVDDVSFRELKAAVELV